MDPVTLKLAKNYAVGPVDLTGQADGDYIRNDAGVYKPKTPLAVITHLQGQDQWGEVPMTAFTQTATSGGGTVTPSFRYITLSTSSIAGTVRARTGQNLGMSIGQIISRIDWRNYIYWCVIFTPANLTSSLGKFWIYWGSQTGDAVDDPIRRGMGIRVDATALKGITHNGTSLTVVDLTTTLTAAEIYKIEMIMDSPNVYWYLDGVYKGTTNQGPTARSNASENTFGAWITDGGETSHYTLALHQMKYYIEQ